MKRYQHTIFYRSEWTVRIRVFLSQLNVTILDNINMICSLGTVLSHASDSLSIHAGRRSGGALGSINVRVFSSR